MADEDTGWSLLVRRESLASRVYKGLGVVPDPEDVAVWVVTLLAAFAAVDPARHGFKGTCVARSGPLCAAAAA